MGTYMIYFKYICLYKHYNSMEQKMIPEINCAD